MDYFADPGEAHGEVAEFIVGLFTLKAVDGGNYRRGAVGANGLEGRLKRKAGIELHFASEKRSRRRKI